MLGPTQAWAAVYSAIKDVEELPGDVRSQILSITVAGSLVRGDFVENRSDVDVHTVFRGAADNPRRSEAHRQLRPCFDRHFAAYRGRSLNPMAWDDVWVSEGQLPREPAESGRHRFKALGIYFFDFLKHHRTVWGEDFTSAMPAPADPKPLAGERLDFLIERAEWTIRDEPEEQQRLPLLAGSAVALLQVYFGPEPSLHKSDLLPRYVGCVPEFAAKPFGLDVLNDYLSGPTHREDLPHPGEEYLAFLKAARELIERNPL